MPHVQLEYSSNLEHAVQAERLVGVVHEAVLATGQFPRWGVRTFAKSVEQFRVAEDVGDAAFIQIVVRISPGRDLVTKQAIGRAVFDAICAALDPLFAQCRLGCQVEVQEFDPAVSHSRFELGTHTTASCSAPSSIPA
ncbi:MAG: 5-carboxymethyl-2-hydroxymuconate Delta-isomerase [Caldimonas sp.]